MYLHLNYKAANVYLEKVMSVTETEGITLVNQRLIRKINRLTDRLACYGQYYDVCLVNQKTYRL